MLRLSRTTLPWTSAPHPSLQDSPTCTTNTEFKRYLVSVNCPRNPKIISHRASSTARIIAASAAMTVDVLQEIVSVHAYPISLSCDNAREIDLPSSLRTGRPRQQPKLSLPWILGSGLCQRRLNRHTFPPTHLVAPMRDLTIRRSKAFRSFAPLTVLKQVLLLVLLRR